MAFYQFTDGNPCVRVDPLGAEWYDWVPFLGTKINYDNDPHGSEDWHYGLAGYLTNDDNCRKLGSAVAEAACASKIESMIIKNASDYLGVALGRSGTDLLAAATAAIVAKNAQSTAAKVATGVGVLLAGDAAVNAGISVAKVVKMNSAGKAAIKRYCKCKKFYACAEDKISGSLA